MEKNYSEVLLKTNIKCIVFIFFIQMLNYPSLQNLDLLVLLIEGGCLGKIKGFLSAA